MNTISKKAKGSAAVLLALLLCVLFACSVSARPSRLTDAAGLLDTEQTEELVRTLDRISMRYRCDVVVLTVNGLGGKSAQAYADDYYDENGYGYGADDNGILLLFAPGERQWAISTKGFGITAFTEAGLDRLCDRVLGLLRQNEYEQAFAAYADECEALLAQARDGTPYGVEEEQQGIDSTDVLLTVLISVGGGLIVALIVVSAMKAKLNSVQGNPAAGGYVRSGSLRLARSSDRFLYSQVTRVPRPKDNGKFSGGSSSRTHVSSSGSTHGGRSGSL